jgi:ferredoxin
MKRNIIRIDEEKCDGCGLCVPSCAEGALEIINGKAKLVGDSFCDGMGNCLGDCPRDAIRIEEREADAFDEEAVLSHAKQVKQEAEPAHTGCPGMKTMSFKPGGSLTAAQVSLPSMLEQWPVQLHLVSPSAPYWNNADILVAASCVPVVFGDFQQKLLKNRRIVIACPKLDRTEGYLEKLTSILKVNSISSVTVAYMEVPCCSGLYAMVEKALSLSGKAIPYRRIKIGIRGEVMEEK